MQTLFFVFFSITLLFLGHFGPKWIKGFRVTPLHKTFEITFRLTFYLQPSIHNEDREGEIVRTKEITIRVSAKNREEALEILEEIVYREMKPELVEFQEILN